ncbi:HupE/UreJ family protein [Variovorax sp.]|uniref:HupE/UreJ family protein n=1 Tax=Variovorax sp. TaxID=1871043 RepID=UPI00137F1FBF|nr:HupE/UreJ family protein [Variovorax sp.]KAF1069085.1 MAG: hypothetical protein GAK39_02955 [Variovorax sp.]
MPFAERRRAGLATALLFVLALLLALAPGAARAHKASDAYLQIQRDAEGLDLRWDIALRDLDATLELDRDGDRQLRWGEVRSRLDDIRAYAFARLQLQQGRCALVEARPPAIEDRVDGAYLVLQLHARCDTGSTLEIDYRLFREIDPTHRGLLRLASDGGASPAVHSLDPAAGSVTLPWPSAVAGSSTPAANAESDSPGFFRDGIHHILIGYDHILFLLCLLCLLLPAVLLRRGDGGWTPVRHWRDAIWPMLGIVTMFTIAHSITLALAGLKIVSLSPRIVEPGIAITIILAAVDNLRPLLRGRRKLFSFLFGLIHGFGFAGALGELDLPLRGFVLALLQFNLGVEAGQLMVVAVALVVLLSLRGWRGYAPVVLRGGSVVAVGVAAIWFCERVFDVKILPFA